MMLPWFCWSRSSNTRRLRGALSRWRAFVLLRRQRAVAERMAAEHRRAALLGRCVGAWLALVQAAAARALHERGMHAYQRMVQVGSEDGSYLSGGTPCCALCTPAP